MAVSKDGRESEGSGWETTSGAWEESSGQESSSGLEGSSGDWVDEDGAALAPSPPSATELLPSSPPSLPLTKGPWPMAPALRIAELVIGAVVAAVVILALVLGFVWWRCRKRSRVRRSSTVGSGQSGGAAPAAPPLVSEVVKFRI